MSGILTMETLLIVLAAVFSLIISGHDDASSKFSPCGETELAQELINDKVAVFVDERSAPLRVALGLQELQPEDPRYVITDVEVCSALREAAIEVLSDQPIWQEIQEHGAYWMMHRIGDYYVVSGNVLRGTTNFPPGPGEEFVLSRNPMLIFVDGGEEGFVYVGTAVI